MAETVVFEPGGYRYLRHAFQYSGGVRAEPGFVVERARFRRPVPLADGFQAVEAHLTAIGRPFTSFCACELRSPEPFTDDGFIAFNRVYVGTLERWGIFKDEENPVARSNVCPEIDPPAEPSFHAFSYTVPEGSGDTAAAETSFVISGAGEAERKPEDTSPAATRIKAQSVLASMEERLEVLGLGWGDVNATQAYTVYEMHSFLGDEIVARGAVPGGLTWHYARPPIVGLDFEMDVRSVPVERLL